MRAFLLCSIVALLVIAALSWGLVQAFNALPGSRGHCERHNWQPATDCGLYDR